MPELPEVETVCRGLSAALTGRCLVRVEVRRPDLRWPIPADFAARLTGARVIAVRRRAKYGLIDTDRGDVAILHLGMSGRIRIDPVADEKHDHVLIEIDSGQRLAFNDARRFGSWHLARHDDWGRHALLADLGPEPLGNTFNGPALHAALAGRRSPVKAALLDQAVVAGVGNIYACEALFQAGIDPSRAACSLTPAESDALAAAVVDVLARAIAAGGSSLRDYVQVDGELGYFQHAWRVYGREGDPCPQCARPVMRRVQSSRSTFYCGSCQT